MSGNVWEWCGDLYTKEYKQGGKSIHPGWPFEGTYLFFPPNIARWKLGEEQQRGVGCRTLITTLRIIVTSMEVFRLVMEPESIK